MKKALINFGHGERISGPNDPGAIGVDGLQEAVQNKEIGVILKLELDLNGWETRTIQTGNLWEIVQFEHEYRPDVFISIHANSADDPRAKGVETLCSEFGWEAEKIARAIQARLVAATGLVDRGVKERPGLYVLKETYAPAVLVETGFISNPVENKLMRDPAFDQAVAVALAGGVSEAMGVKYTPMSKKPAAGVYYFGENDWTAAKYVAAKAGAAAGDIIPRGKYRAGAFDLSIFVGGPKEAPGDGKKLFLCGADWIGTMREVLNYLEGGAA